MNKVLVVGISGTGKTRFSKILGEKLDLPVVHLDSIFWKENWVEEDEKIVREKIQKEINKNKWIIEGYIEPLSKERVEAADKVFYLDYAGLSALIGGLQRFLKHRKTPRPEMPAGNTDDLGYKFLRSLYNRDERPEIEKAIHSSSKVIRLHSRKEANNYLERLKS